jgi:hypothetical protein
MLKGDNSATGIEFHLERPTNGSAPLASPPPGYNVRVMCLRVPTAAKTDN